MHVNRFSAKQKTTECFGQSREAEEMSQAGLYAWSVHAWRRTLSLQRRTIRELCRQADLL